MIQRFRRLAARHGIPYRGLPDIDPDRWYTIEDVPELIDYLESDYFLDRELAAKQLSHVVRRHRSQQRATHQTRQQLSLTIPRLTRLRVDPSPAVREAAITALEALAPLFPERIDNSAADQQRDVDSNADQ